MNCAALLSLPPEHIHLLAQNPNFPSSTSHIYNTLHNAPSSYIATYLLSLYEKCPTPDMLTRAVRHPVCDVAVIRDMVRIWDRRRGYFERAEVDQSKAGGKRKCNHCSESNSRSEGDSDSEGDEADDEGTRSEPIAPSLICSELPKRIFRSLSLENNSHVPELLEHLFSSTSFSPDPNSHRGYPLCRAVLTRNIPLIRLLVKHGANPGIREGLAVEVAISGGDVEIVKLLIDRDERSGAKKRRLSRDTRIEITPKLVEAAMRSGSEKIVEYFVNEKGVMPPLHSIMKLGRTSSKRPLVNKANGRWDKRAHSTKRSSIQGSNRSIF